MSMQSQNSRRYVRRLCTDALLLAVAMLLSYLEVLLPLSLIIPLPGVKLGLCNLAVMFVFFAISPADAAGISLVRVVLSALLFGSPVSFFFAICGAVLSYAGLFCFGLLKKHGRLTFVGVSVGCAVLHSVGQTVAAMIIYTPSAFFYLPWLMTASILTGIVTGLIMNFIFTSIKRAINVKN